MRESIVHNIGKSAVVRAGFCGRGLIGRAVYTTLWYPCPQKPQSGKYSTLVPKFERN